ncbi:hypothetical protein AAG906_017137 [Vitis piasezkii]
MFKLIVLTFSLITTVEGQNSFDEGNGRKLRLKELTYMVSIISNANGTLEKIEPVKLPNGPGGENLQDSSHAYIGTAPSL